MRAVVDTNVLISGVLWFGAPHRLLGCAGQGQMTLVSCRELLEEFAAVIVRPTFARYLDRAGVSADDVIVRVRMLVEVGHPMPLPAPVSRDPDDDVVLALAAVSRVDLIVSGDRDLLDLESFRGIPIVDAATALTIVKGS